MKNALRTVLTVQNQIPQRYEPLGAVEDVPSYKFCSLLQADVGDGRCPAETDCTTCGLLFTTYPHDEWLCARCATHARVLPFYGEGTCSRCGGYSIVLTKRSPDCATG